MFVIFGGGKNATRCICMIAEGILAVSVSFWLVFNYIYVQDCKFH
jgi:hypothetical protein